jgi:hypothetical protein
MKLAADINNIGGGQPDFPVAAASIDLDSVTGAAVSILVVWRGAKKFFVATVTADVGRAVFFGVWAASPVKCLFRLKLKLKYDRQSVGPSVLVSGTHLGPATNFSS